MKTGSLSRRAAIATLGVLVVALGGFAMVITLRYRDGLRARARSQLLAGAEALQAAPGDEVKPQIASLALEGIDVTMNPGATPTKPGAPRHAPLKPGVLASSGDLLTVTVPVRAGDGMSTATLSTSEA
ncbi:MAG: hypothetical protein ACXVRP_14220, partial [Solirubrobacteraceae bacterium]